MNQKKRHRRQLLSSMKGEPLSAESKKAKGTVMFVPLDGFVGESATEEDMRIFPN